MTTDINTFKKLAQAATTTTLVTFTYTDKKGEKSIRTIEPYSIKIKGGSRLLYGHDLKRDEIRAFNLTRVSGLTNTKTKFIPKWPFEFPGVKINVMGVKGNTSGSKTSDNK